MNVLVLGSGGREHALAWKIALSPLVETVYCAPGNAGTLELAENVHLDITDHRAIYRFCKQHGVELAVIGAERPLCDGLTDRLQSRGLRVYGPTRRAARIEGSKVFAKALMRCHVIPTAEYKAFDDERDARKYLQDRAENEYFPVVVKADGLCGGKGVFVCADLAEANEAVTTLMRQRRFEDAGAKVVIEEALVGEEVSVFAICGDQSLAVLEDACDYKRLRDGDEGPNTGGMGAYSPSGLIDPKTRAVIEEKILVGALHALRREDSPFRGTLYAGLMLGATGPKVLEFNARFGDPETQCILPRLQSDLVPLLIAAADGTPFEEEMEWDPRAAVTVIVAADGYPDAPRSGSEVRGLDRLRPCDDVFVFHAGTRRDRTGRVVAAGGRVLAITALGADHAAARRRVYEAVQEVDFAGSFWRTDIAARVSGA